MLLYHVVCVYFKLSYTVNKLDAGLSWRAAVCRKTVLVNVVMERQSGRIVCIKAPLPAEILNCIYPQMIFSIQINIK